MSMKITRLFPYYKSALWGGDKLVENYGKTPSFSPLAESWELSAIKGKESFVGMVPLSALGAEQTGGAVSDLGFFPLLVKFIDAALDLSVQVHPDDEYARAHENSLGKTECWYVVEARAGAGIYLGLKRDCTEEEIAAAVRNGSVLSLLNFVPVAAGDAFFVPAGVPHAIGKGCLICEIQQSSDVTYRLYDYDRVGADGKKRELHIDKALSAMSHGAFDLCANRFHPKEGEEYARSKYFACFVAKSGEEYEFERSFCCVTAVEGEGTLNGEKISRGDSFFVPAGKKFCISGAVKALCAYVPDKEKP